MQGSREAEAADGRTDRQMNRWTSRQKESRQKESKRTRTPANLSSCGLLSVSRVLCDEDGRFVLSFDENRDGLVAGSVKAAKEKR